MNKKLKLTLAALLGFSAACSTVKNTPAQPREEEPGQQTATPQKRDSTSLPPRVVLMYGVRMPEPLREVKSLDEMDDQLDPVAEKPVEDTPDTMDEQLDPVAEKPVEDTPYMNTKKGSQADTGAADAKPAAK